MKRTILYIAFALAGGMTFSTPAKAASCSTDFIKTEKNLYKIYQKLRKTHATCHYSGMDFVNFGMRAYLAGRYGESLWAIESGISQKNPKSVQMQLYYMRGLAYLGRGRNEEAISTLKKVAMERDSTSVKELEVKQRAHMALIEAYYAKSGSKNDTNVQFLVNLFRRRYPKSRYMPVLENWLSSSSLP